MSEIPLPPPGTPERDSRDRADIARILGESDWTPADRALLAALVRLGPPAQVVHGFSSPVAEETGEGDKDERLWGTLGLRAVCSPQLSARAAMLTAYRELALAEGLPRPEPPPRKS